MRTVHWHFVKIEKTHGREQFTGICEDGKTQGREQFIAAFAKLANQRMQVYFFLSDMKIGTGISLGDTHALACLHFLHRSLNSLCSDEHVTSVHFRLRFYPSVVTCDSRGVPCGGQEARSWPSTRWKVRQFRQKSR